MAIRQKAVKKRSGIIKVTVSEAERTLLAKAASQSGLPLALFVRSAALEKAQGMAATAAVEKVR